MADRKSSRAADRKKNRAADRKFRADWKSGWAARGRRERQQRGKPDHADTDRDCGDVLRARHPRRADELRARGRRHQSSLRRRLQPRAGRRQHVPGRQLPVLRQARLVGFEAVNFALNFLLYCAVNTHFRQTFVRIVYRAFRCRTIFRAEIESDRNPEAFSSQAVERK